MNKEFLLKLKERRKLAPVLEDFLLQAGFPKLSQYYTKQRAGGACFYGEQTYDGDQLSAVFAVLGFPALAGVAKAATGETLEDMNALLPVMLDELASGNYVFSCHDDELAGMCA